MSNGDVVVKPKKPKEGQLIGLLPHTDPTWSREGSRPLCHSVTPSALKNNIVLQIARMLPTMATTDTSESGFLYVKHAEADGDHHP